MERKLIGMITSLGLCMLLGMFLGLMFMIAGAWGLIESKRIPSRRTYINFLIFITAYLGHGGHGTRSRCYPLWNPVAFFSHAARSLAWCHLRLAAIGMLFYTSTCTDIACSYADTDLCSLPARCACEAATKTRSGNTGIEVMPRDRRPTLSVHRDSTAVYFLQHLLHVERLG